MIKIALVQMDSKQEAPDENLNKIIDNSKKAKMLGAEIVLFHEGTLTDYVSDVDQFAQEVPSGSACQEIWKLAEELKIYISFGLIEKEGIHRYITQVFLGPNKFLYKYRKTSLYPTTDRIKSVRRHRNEPDFFDPGQGPELFNIKGITTSCIICNDANVRRPIEIIKQLSPKIVFFPNNREIGREENYWAEIAKNCGAVLLITNRVGKSWGEECEGGCAVYSKEGKLLAEANKEGKEEILLFNLNEEELKK